MRSSLVLLCLVCFVTLVACASGGKGKGSGKGGNGKGYGWKRRAGAPELQAEWSQYFDVFNTEEKFAAIQDKLEDFRRRGAESKGKVFDPDHPRNKNWMRKDKTEAGQNEKVDDFLLEGDIVPSPDLLDRFESYLGRVKRKVIDVTTFGARYKWYGTVHYSISAGIRGSSKHLAAVKAGIEFWSTHSCIDFSEDSNAYHKITFFLGRGCYSSIGKQGGSQGISIGHGCEYAGIVQHEIAHALGMFHEQSRTDRNDYVEIMHSNIETDYYTNFNTYPQYYMNYFSQPYDYGSVMHYGPWGFAIDDDQPTINTQDPRYQHVIGQRIGASFVDVAQINAQYGCQMLHCEYLVNCKNGGIQNSRSRFCSKCICPEGFGGETCDEIEPSSDEACGGTMVAIDRWTEIDVSASGKSKCIWHITSSNGVIAQILDSGFGFPCDVNGCMHGYVEVKLGPDYRPAGPRSCCQAPTATYTTDETMIIISRLEATTNSQFKLKFKAK